MKRALRAGTDAALERVRKSYQTLFDWRRGISQALYTDDNRQVHVPIYVSLLLIAGYIAIGSLMFGLWEKDWDVLIASYFCFVTLSTIGFGDFVPGSSLKTSSTSKLVLCALYLLCGLALLAMCFELMQEEARKLFRSAASWLGLAGKETTATAAGVHSKDEDVDGDGDSKLLETKQDDGGVELRSSIAIV